MSDFDIAADEVLKAKTQPKIEDAYDCASISVPTQAWLSALAVSCAWKAENPEDDGDPADIGFAESCLADRDSILVSVRSGTLTISIESYMVNPTRGDIRRLCKALGIALKNESTEAPR